MAIRPNATACQPKFRGRAPTSELGVLAGRYEPTNVDVSIIVDDTMCKGIDRGPGMDSADQTAVVPGGAMLVTSDRDPTTCSKRSKVKPYAWNLVICQPRAGRASLRPKARLAFGALAR